MQKKDILLKKIVLSIGTEFVYGGHLLSTGASGIVLTVVLLLNLPLNIVVLVIPYLSSQIIYTHNHFKELTFDLVSNPERANYISGENNIVKFLLILYGLLLITFLMFTNVPTILYVVFVVGGGILYTDYFKELTVKYIAGLKNFYTSFFWAVSIFLVSFFYGTQITTFFTYFFLFVFLRWIVNSAFFDIKDIKSDKQRSLKTFAVIFGKRGTIYLLNIVNLASLFILIIGVLNKALPNETLFLIVSVIYGFYYLTHALFLEGSNLRKLSYVVVDAEYIFWPILILIGNLIR